MKNNEVKDKCRILGFLFSNDDDFHTIRSNIIWGVRSSNLELFDVYYKYSVFIKAFLTTKRCRAGTAAISI